MKSLPIHYSRVDSLKSHILSSSLNVKVKLLSPVQLFATTWTGAYQATRSMGFSRQEYWSGLPFPFPSSFLLSLKYGLFLSLDWRTSKLVSDFCFPPSNHMPGSSMNIQIMSSPCLNFWNYSILYRICTHVKDFSHLSFYVLSHHFLL